MARMASTTWKRPSLWVSPRPRDWAMESPTTMTRTGAVLRAPPPGSVTPGPGVPGTVVADVPDPVAKAGVVVARTATTLVATTAAGVASLARPPRSHAP